MRDYAFGIRGKRESDRHKGENQDLFEVKTRVGSTKGENPPGHSVLPSLLMYEVAIGRSGNLWDFRKLSDTQWCPTGPARTMWNEPGNLLGFPACALAAMIAVPDSPYNARLLQISTAQMDNAFGRNPTGRCFSYDAPREIEGCDLGWFSYVQGGIGQLGDVRFVFDGAPKNEHYPYDPHRLDRGDGSSSTPCSTSASPSWRSPTPGLRRSAPAAKSKSG